MTQDLDANIVRLVAALNAFPGIETTQSCGGHDKPANPGQALAGGFTVIFQVEQSPRGWLALEFLAWAINAEGPGALILFPWAAPPWLNTPGKVLRFVLEGRGSDPDDLAGWLDDARTRHFAGLALGAA